MTRFLLYLTILIWPFGLLLTYRSGIFNFPIYYLDIATLLLSISVATQYHTYKDLFVKPIIKAQLLFSLVLLLSLLVNIFDISTYHRFTSLFYLARVIIYPSIFLAAKKVNQLELRKVISLSVIIFIIIAVLQYLFFPDLRFLKNIGFDDHYYRLVGGLFDPNYTGAIISAITLYFLFSGQTLLSLLLLVPLALTFSRASYLSFVVPVIIGFINKRTKSLRLLLVFGLLAIIIYLIPKPFGEGVNLLRTFSIYSRFSSWQDGFGLFWQRPLLGWGYNTLYSSIGSRFSIDNSFIYILATSGIFGILSFLNLLRESIRLSNYPTKIFISSLLIHSLFNNSFFFIWILAPFWLAISLSSKE